MERIGRASLAPELDGKIALSGDHITMPGHVKRWIFQSIRFKGPLAMIQNTINLKTLSTKNTFAIIIMQWSKRKGRIVLMNISPKTAGWTFGCKKQRAQRLLGRNDWVKLYSTLRTTLRGNRRSLAASGQALINEMQSMTPSAFIIHSIQITYRSTVPRRYKS